jgi:predicted MFS family arabinose efflux permease
VPLRVYLTLVWNRYTLWVILLHKLGIYLIKIIIFINLLLILQFSSYLLFMLNKQLKILLIANNIWYLGEGMFNPIFAVYTQKIGGSLLDISSAWATYLIATGIFTIFVGKISDEKISKEKLLVSGYALNAIFTFCYLFVASQTYLFIVQIGLGIASALATPTWYALYAQHENKKASGYIWGMAGGQSQFMTGISVFIGGFIVNYFSFETLFIVMGSIQVIATCYLAQIFRIHNNKNYI